MLVVFSSPLLYTNFIRPPIVGDPIPEYILNNPKLYPFFEDALRTIDGSYFNTFATSNWDALHNCSGALTTTALAICDFSLCFLHTQSSWEGSVADTQMFYNSCFTDLSIPDGKHLQMWGSPPALPYLFHIVVHNITFLNGVALS